MAHENNILTKLVVTIASSPKGPAGQLGQSCNEILDKTLIAVDNVYSYLVYAEYSEQKLTSWSVEFIVSQTRRFNTISKETAIKNVGIIILDSWHAENIKYVVGYKQPPLDTLLEIFDPLIKKLARKQLDYWQNLEYDDLYQMCCLVICTLYTKGYYVHKRLIEKAYINYVLGHIKKDRYKPEMQSLDEPISGDGEGNLYTAMDLVPDQQAESEFYEQFEEEHNRYIIEQKRDIIVEYIGQRSYDQLLREYGNGMTTNAGRKQVYRIKEYLRSIGISETSFI